MIEIVGLIGKSGTGKSYVAKNVFAPRGFLPVAFAWPLKLEAMRLRGYSYDDVFRAKPPEVRAFLQEHGMAMRDLHGDAHWLVQLRQLIEVLLHEGGQTRFVITDVRMRNEVEAVHAWGGKLVRMLHGDRPYPLAGTEAALHRSETELDGVELPLGSATVINGRECTAAIHEEQLVRQGVLAPRKLARLK